MHLDISSCEVSPNLCALVPWLRHVYVSHIVWLTVSHCTPMHWVYFSFVLKATISRSGGYTGLVSTRHVHCYAGHLRQWWALHTELDACCVVFPFWISVGCLNDYLLIIIRLVLKLNARFTLGFDADLLTVFTGLSRHPSLKHLHLGKNFNIKSRYGIF